MGRMMTYHWYDWEICHVYMYMYMYMYIYMYIYSVCVCSHSCHQYLSKNDDKLLNLGRYGEIWGIMCHETILKITENCNEMLVNDDNSTLSWFGMFTGRQNWCGDTLSYGNCLNHGIGFWGFKCWDNPKNDVDIGEIFQDLQESHGKTMGESASNGGQNHENSQWNVELRAPPRFPCEKWCSLKVS